ncbi:MAG: phosphoribosylamine--glycine ligase [Spirochaetota bacterium]
MRILVVGNGAREHALVWKFSRSNRISGLFALPGNAGTAGMAENVPNIAADDVEGVVRSARDLNVNLVFVGPEAPLAAGLVDALTAEGIHAIGPHARAAELESSKATSKAFMTSYGIPTADHRTFTDADDLERYVRSSRTALVVKKSGLAAGKGVIESDDVDRLAEAGRRFIDEGDSVVVEERLSGYEVSVFGISDGDGFVLLPAATDYKKAGVGGSGPNTGGMGALSPVPWLTPEDHGRILTTIVEPTYRGLKEAGLAYRGVLYFGIMVTESGPMLLEYNVRLGDPETQVVLPLLRSDLANLCDAAVNGTVGDFPIRISNSTALGVVVAAPGYPSEYPKGIPVEQLPSRPDNEALLFHAATATRDGAVVTGGGRCFTVVGVGPELLTARTRAYTAAKEVIFPGSWFRPDIGGRIFG